MAKTLKDLALALINATLILIILSLFLAWRVTSTAENLTIAFAQNIKVLEPLRLEVENMTREVAGLRADVAGLKSGANNTSLATKQRLEEKVSQLNDRLEGIGVSFEAMKQSPEDLINMGFVAAGDQVVRVIADLRGCIPVSQTSALTLPDPAIKE